MFEVEGSADVSAVGGRMRWKSLHIFMTMLVILVGCSKDKPEGETDQAQQSQLTQQDEDKAVEEAVTKKSKELETKLADLQKALEEANKSTGKTVEILPEFFQKYADKLEELGEQSKKLSDQLNAECTTATPIEKGKADAINSQITQILELLVQMESDLTAHKAGNDALITKMNGQIDALKNLLTSMQAFPCLKSKVCSPSIISGVVKDATTKNPIGGARVLYEEVGGTDIRSVLTDSKGNFKTENLSGKQYRVTVSHSSYQTSTSILVNRCENKPLDVNLQPTSTPPEVVAANPSSKQKISSELYTFAKIEKKNESDITLIYGKNNYYLLYDHQKEAHIDPRNRGFSNSSLTFGLNKQNETTFFDIYIPQADHPEILGLGVKDVIQVNFENHLPAVSLNGSGEFAKNYFGSIQGKFISFPRIGFIKPNKGSSIEIAFVHKKVSITKWRRNYKKNTSESYTVTKILPEISMENDVVLELEPIIQEQGPSVISVNDGNCILKYRESEDSKWLDLSIVRLDFTTNTVTIKRSDMATRFLKIKNQNKTKLALSCGGIVELPAYNSAGLPLKIKSKVFVDQGLGIYINQK